MPFYFGELSLNMTIFDSGKSGRIRTLETVGVMFTNRQRTRVRAVHVMPVEEPGCGAGNRATVSTFCQGLKKSLEKLQEVKLRSHFWTFTCKTTHLPVLLLPGCRGCFSLSQLVIGGRTETLCIRHFCQLSLMWGMAVLHLCFSCAWTWQNLICTDTLPFGESFLFLISSESRNS